MKNRKFIVLIILLIFNYSGQIHVAMAEDGPIIHIDPISHTFPDVFEGEALSHDFVVVNKGSADLVIKDVTHQ
jgi:hypothetical protein